MLSRAINAPFETNLKILGVPSWRLRHSCLLWLSYTLFSPFRRLWS